MSKFKRNQAAFKNFRDRLPYRDVPFEASTGKLNSDGTVNPNPSDGLDEGFVWVRRKGERAETRAYAGKVRTDIADIPVLVAQDNITGELTVQDIRASEAVSRFGGAWARSMYAQPIGEAFRVTIDGRNIKPGRIKVWIPGTLQVNAEEFWYNNTAQARVLWEPSDTNVLDLSGNVPAAVGGINYQRWVVIALNPNATTPALVAFNSTAINAASTLLKASIADIAVTAGYTRLAAVQLRTGDTGESDITDNEWEDLRPWVVDVNYSTITGAVITNSTIDSTVIGGNVPADGTFEDIIGETLYITGGAINAVFGDGTTGMAIELDGAAGNSTSVLFTRGGSRRWAVLANGENETGSDTGTDFNVARYDDAGNLIGNSWVIDRATGGITMTADDTGTTNNLTVMRIGHRTSGTAANGFGVGVILQGEADAGTLRSFARWHVSLSDATDASRKTTGALTAFDTSERTFLTFGANGSAPTVAFLGATAAARQGSTTDLKDMAVTFGFITDSGATPLNLDGGALTAGTTIVSVNDGTPGGVVNVLTATHNTTGTPAIGLGTGILVNSETSTAPDTNLASIQAFWSTVTHASRKGKVTFNVYDTAAREAIAIEASGTAPMIGFLGAAAVARPAVTGSRGGNAALADLLTQLATLGLITDSTSA